jgi:hypothetical protein
MPQSHEIIGAVQYLSISAIEIFTAIFRLDLLTGEFVGNSPYHKVGRNPYCPPSSQLFRRDFAFPGNVAETGFVMIFENSVHSNSLKYVCVSIFFPS